MTLLDRSLDALTALASGVRSLPAELDPGLLEEASRRGHFLPDEEERLVGWFARFLTVRHGLWQVIGEVSAPVDGDPAKVRTREDWCYFAVGYVAACQLVRLDRLLVEEVATDKLVQRKLNEGSSTHRIPRKQFTAVFDSLSSPDNALLMYRAMRLAQRRRSDLLALRDDPRIGAWIEGLELYETALDPSRRRYLRLLLTYLRHAITRRGASARQQITFAALETGGRVVAELQDRRHPKRVDDRIRDQIRALLRPGDVLVTRHERVLTNLFLPGYWPHAALYVGEVDAARRRGVRLNDLSTREWSGERVVLEALKDGVRFRPLEETLAVDAVAVLRPRLAEDDIARGLERAAAHAGKLYNFDFDFFRSDRLVCTEVVYRAYDGLGGAHFELRERAGRPTLSAEDLLDMALTGELFEPLALFGSPSGTDRLVTGHRVANLLAASYDSTTADGRLGSEEA